MESTLLELSQSFGALLVIGARQSGKTTLLTHTFPDAVYMTFDDRILLNAARSDPESFLSLNAETQAIIDEVQYVPELFPVIKRRIDSEKLASLRANTSRFLGRYLLTGSQQFHMMKNVSESLAGRVGIAILSGLSLREIQGDSFDMPFIPTENYRAARRNAASKTLSGGEIWDVILRGSMPELHADPSIDAKKYYGAYINTYIERDVRALTQVGDERAFFSFMVTMAARTGQLLNLSDVAKDVGISVPTAKRWLSVLQTSNIVYLLQPWHANITKRVVKTPKIYFLDTGLAAQLAGWNTVEALARGASSGAFFETFVISEALKSYYNKGDLRPPFYFYRDRQGNEIDLIILENGVLYPVEIKKSAAPRKEDTASFAQLGQCAGSGMKRGPGALVCMYEEFLPLTKTDWIFPVSRL
ncbi:MAG: ATP-binding protein [Synergistaceae bacterium]|jgi:predicted AAA+ superfamily ATPase|nr:ATP-binding protein [Synergistaceae bacterium]